MADLTRLPRVLIVTPNQIGDSSGGGIWLDTLFRDWPAEKLGQIYSKERASNCKSERGPRFLGLTGLPRRMFRRNHKGSGSNATSGVVSFDGVISYRVPRKLTEFVDTFKPEIIYTFFGPIWLTRLAVCLARSHKCQLVCHIMDDYVTSWPVNGVRWRNLVPGVAILNLLNRRVFAKATSACRVRYVASRSMQEEYRERYGMKATLLQVGVDRSEWENLLNPPTRRDSLRIIYAGSVSEAVNLNAIKRFAAAVVSMRANGASVQFELFVPGHCRHLVNRLNLLDGVSVRSAVGREEIKKILVFGDILLLPFNYEAWSTRFTRLSWPTKISEYMASGTPILAVGSNECGFMQYLAENKAAYTDEGRSVEMIESVLWKLLKGAEERQVVGRRARSLAFSNHLNSAAIAQLTRDLVEVNE